MFQLEDTRVLFHDWVIRYDTRYLQVARQSHLASARRTVLVREAVTGAIELRYRGRLMRWTEIPAPPPKPAITTATRPAIPASTRAPAQRRGQSADHRWHHSVEDYRTRLQVAAAKRAWMAGQP